MDVLVAKILGAMPMTAASFIVTVYGDVALPRGEVLSMGSLIDICRKVGISENLVRTAVSRLVSGGQLVGERVGRRSFYSLAPKAHAEFLEAARLLYARDTEAPGWQVVYAPDLIEREARRRRMGRMGAEVWLYPGPAADVPAALTLNVTAIGGASGMARFWDLEALRHGYDALLAGFDPVAAKEVGDALTLRLLLVHFYRAVVLRDPGLPRDALPEDWPGRAARDLFCDLYLSLSPSADAQIGLLEGNGDPLPAVTDPSRERLMALR